MRSIFCLASSTASSFFAARLLSVERARMGRSAQSRVDADTPLRPLPHRHDVVAAILPGFRCRHLGPPCNGPPSCEYLAEAYPGGRDASHSAFKSSARLLRDAPPDAANFVYMLASGAFSGNRRG